MLAYPWVSFPFVKGRFAWLFGAFAKYWNGSGQVACLILHKQLRKSRLLIIGIVGTP
jgi:hypothetical protein